MHIFFTSIYLDYYDFFFESLFDNCLSMILSLFCIPYYVRFIFFSMSVRFRIAIAFQGFDSTLACVDSNFESLFWKGGCCMCYAMLCSSSLYFSLCLHHHHQDILTLSLFVSIIPYLLVFYNFNLYITSFS
jgi:hypothetical protein